MKEKKFTRLFRLEEFRKAENLSVADFAQKLSITPEEYQGLVGGTVYATEEEVEKISVVLNCFPSYLTGQVDVNFPRKRTQIYEQPASNAPTAKTVPKATTKRKALRCPICGGIDLAFVTDYHKAKWPPIIKAFLTFALILIIAIRTTHFIFVEFTFESLIGLIILVGLLWFGTMVCDLVKINIESRTHIRGICRDCGKLWYVD